MTRKGMTTPLFIAATHQFANSALTVSERFSYTGKGKGIVKGKDTPKTKQSHTFRWRGSLKGNRFVTVSRHHAVTYVNIRKKVAVREVYVQDRVHFQASRLCLEPRGPRIWPTVNIDKENVSVMPKGNLSRAMFAIQPEISTTSITAPSRQAA